MEICKTFISVYELEPRFSWSYAMFTDSSSQSGYWVQSVKLQNLSQTLKYVIKNNTNQLIICFNLYKAIKISFIYYKYALNLVVIEHTNNFALNKL